MKSEERHHLKENDLEKILVKAQGVFEKNTNLFIWGGIIILVAIVVSVVIKGGGPSATDEAAWSSLIQARTPEDFGKIANDKELSGKKVAILARLEEATILYSRGLNLLFSDREGALSDLKQAGENFNKIYEDAQGDPSLQEKALYGLACVQETSSDGDLTEALASYEKLLQYENSVMKSVYEKRIEKMKTGESQALYKWMAENPAKPVDRNNPLDGKAENPLEQFGIPLETKEDAVEETKGEEKAPEETKPVEAAEDAPVEEAATPEKPTTEKAEAEKTEVDKPEADKPAEGTPTEETPEASDKTPEQEASSTEEEETEPAKSE